jgi:hypothetical protein
VVRLVRAVLGKEASPFDPGVVLTLAAVVSAEPASATRGRPHRRRCPERALLAKEDASRNVAYPTRRGRHVVGSQAADLASRREVVRSRVAGVGSRRDVRWSREDVVGSLSDGVLRPATGRGISIRRHGISTGRREISRSGCGISTRRPMVSRRRRGISFRRCPSTCNRSCGLDQTSWDLDQTPWRLDQAT